MDVVLGTEDLRQEIILQAAPEVIVDLAGTSEVFRKQLQSSKILKSLGERFGWYLPTFDDFIDAYYTSFLTPQVYELMDYERSFEMALKAQDLKVADKLFEFLRFHNGIDERFILRMRPVAIFVGPMTDRWFNKKASSYRIDTIHIADLKAAAKRGDIERLNQLLSHHLNVCQDRWPDLLSSGFASGKLEMVDRVLYGLPIDALSWKNNNGKIRYVNDLSIFNQGFWDRLMGGAIESGNSLMLDDVMKRASKYGFTLDQPSLRMAEGAAKSHDLFFVDEYLIPYISGLGEDDESYDLKVIVSELLADYHSNNLPIVKKILDALPKDLMKPIVHGLFEGIIETGNLNILHYVADFYKLSPKQLDVIYQYVVMSYDDHVINQKLFPTLYQAPKGSIKTFTTLKGRIISWNDLMKQFDIPTHPGMLKWFRRHGEDSQLYKIDPIGLIVIEQSHSMRHVILSYRLTPSKEWVIEAARSSKLTAHPTIYRQLLGDYRIGCAHFTESETEFLRNLEIINNDPRFHKHLNPVVIIHQISHLSYAERYQLMEKEAGKIMERDTSFILLSREENDEILNLNATKRLVPKIKRRYLSSNEDLSRTLNTLEVPFIPCFDHLAVSIFLSPTDRWIGPLPRDSDLEMILPSGIYQYYIEVYHYMNEKGTNWAVRNEREKTV